MQPTRLKNVIIVGNDDYLFLAPKYFACVRQLEPKPAPGLDVHNSFWLCNRVAKTYNEALKWIEDEQSKKPNKVSWDSMGVLYPVNRFQGWFPIFSHLPPNVKWADK